MASPIAVTLSTTKIDQTNKGTAAQGSNSVFSSNNLTTSPSSNITGEAVLVALSSGQTGNDRARTQAARTLSDAISFTDIAAQATKDIERLVSKAKEIAESLESSLNPAVKDALAEEGEALIEEINSVVDNATFRDESVIGAGNINFSGSFSSATSASPSTFSITVLDVAVSQSELALTNINKASFLTDTENTISALSSASEQLEYTRLNLEEAQNRIENTVRQYGARAQIAIESEALLTGSSALSLAGEIAERVNDSLSSINVRLNNKQLADLLDQSNLKGTSTNSKTTSLF